MSAGGGRDRSSPPRLRQGPPRPVPRPRV